MNRFILVNKEIPIIELSERDRQTYDNKVRDMLADTLVQYSNYTGKLARNEWSLIRKEKYMSIYRDARKSSNPDQRFVRGIGVFQGTLHETMDGLYSDNTHDLRCMKTHLKHDCLDAAVLNVSEKQSHESPYNFAGIKWFAMRAAWGLVRTRDLLTYERTGMTTDSQGNQIGYHILYSIDRPEWPVGVLPGVSRGYTSTCYLYKPTPDGKNTKVFMTGEMYGMGMLAKVSEYVAAQKWTTVVRAPATSRAKRLSKMMKEKEPVDRSVMSNKCDVCHKTASNFSNFHQCASCWKQVCKRCSMQKNIYEVNMHKRRPLSKLFCIACIIDGSQLHFSDCVSIVSETRKSQSDFANEETPTSANLVRNSKSVGADDDIEKLYPPAAKGSCRNERSNSSPIPAIFMPTKTSDYPQVDEYAMVVRSRITSSICETKSTVDDEPEPYPDYMGMIERLSRKMTAVTRQLDHNEEVMMGDIHLRR